MKRKLSLVIAALLALSLLAGCSNSTPASKSMASSTSKAAPSSAPAKESAGITIWHEANETIAEVLQKQLDSLAPEIEVKLERKEQMSDALKLVGNNPDSAPDMYFWAHDKIGVFAEMGILAPLDELVDGSLSADLMPMSIEAGRYKDNRYQMPVYFETLLFMYNKGLMETPPATTDDLLALMQSETKDGDYVFVEQHSTAYNAAAWIQGYGGFIIDSSAKPGLDSEQTVEALTYHAKFVPFMPEDGEYNTVTTLFSEGKSQSTIGGPWMVPGLKEAGIDLGIATMPALPNGKPLTPFSGVQGVSVLKHAMESKKDSVARVLEVLAQPDTGIQLAKAANCAPVNIKAYDDAEVSSNEMIKVMQQIAENVVPMPNVPEMDIMWGITDGLLASINKNGAEVGPACEKAQKDALEQIAAMQ